MRIFGGFCRSAKSSAIFYKHSDCFLTLKCLADQLFRMAVNKFSSYPYAEKESPCSIQQPLKYYTDFAGAYNQECQKLGNAGPAKTASIVADYITGTLRANVRILDVGAGTGLVAVELRDRGFKHIDALDPSEAMLSIAKASGLYENYFVDFLTETPSSIPADSYDVITGCCIYADEGHVPCNALMEMVRLVKPGGLVVLSSQHHSIQEVEEYRGLEPLMDRLEADGKWKKRSRELVPKFYAGKDGVTWCYQVL